MEQVSIEDAKAFFTEHEAAALSASAQNQIYDVNLASDFNGTLSFVYNGDEIVLDIDKVKTAIITYMYDVNNYEESDFYTNGYQTWYGDGEYHIISGGVEYSFRGTHYNYGEANAE